jgi:hypothetical protein
MQSRNFLTSGRSWLIKLAQGVKGQVMRDDAPIAAEGEPFTRDELVAAVVDNLRSCHRRTNEGPPVRIVPESLCLEIELALAFGTPELSLGQCYH